MKMSKLPYSKQTNDPRHEAVDNYEGFRELVTNSVPCHCCRLLPNYVPGLFYSVFLAGPPSAFFAVSCFNFSVARS